LTREELNWFMGNACRYLFDAMLVIGHDHALRDRICRRKVRFFEEG